MAKSDDIINKENKGRPQSFVTLWAEDGQKFKNIPENEKDKEALTGTEDELKLGMATMVEGFPEITMRSVSRGGVPPWGKDHNKILNWITEAIRWMQAGGCAFFNQKLCDKIEGYPKGAILQSERLPLVLWFSTIDDNNNDPDITLSPENGWVKLDFANLESRLNFIELNKADLNGSCSIPFHAETMSAQKYGFCNSPKGKGGSITQEEGRVKFHSDAAFDFALQGDVLGNIASFSGKWDTEKKNLTTFCGLKAVTVSVGGGWFTINTPTSIEDQDFMLRKNKPEKQIVWLNHIDDTTNDYSVEYKVYDKQTDKETKTEVLTLLKSNEVLRLSADDYCLKANKYGFLNSGEGKGGYITQEEGSVNFYGDKEFSFRFKNNSTDNTHTNSNDILTLACDKDNITDVLLSATNIKLSADTNINLQSQWVNISNSVFVVNDSLMQMVVTKKDVPADSKSKITPLITWQTEIDIKTDSDQTVPFYDYIISFFDNTDNSKAKEVLRLSAETGDVAAHGKFINLSGNGLAEYYQADSLTSNYEMGTLMCHGFDSEVTLCRNIDQADNFFGVVSANPGYVMNGQGKESTNSVLIALNGKTPVKVKGSVKYGDKITIGQDGYGIVSKDKSDVIVGRAKENKTTEEVGLVSCYVQAHC